jgi:hypothetical protein
VSFHLVGAKDGAGMLTALVLICSIAVTPDLRGNPASCLMHGQAYMANTSGQELGDKERVKIVCARIETIDASIPRLKVE